jgi:tetratricopeptide (TPR) repeat protein
MRRVWISALLVLLAAGCGGSSPESRRFKAESELFALNKDWQELNIKPELVAKEDRIAIADRYVALADRYRHIAVTTDTSAAGQADLQTRAIAARALITAGDIHAGLNEGTVADSLYGRVLDTYEDLPRMVAEAAIDRGMVAEREGRLRDAAAAYARAVGRVMPSDEGEGPERKVMPLPLRIARIRAQAAADTLGESRAPYYKETRAYYEALADRYAGQPLGIEARSRLVDAATDLGEWSEAIRQLRVLEEETRKLPGEARDLGEFRYAIAEAQRRLGQEDDGAATLESILREAPKSPMAPRALIALALHAENKGRIPEALAYLERVPMEYPGAEDERALAMLARGRIYEQTGRWQESLELYRALPLEHPLSEPALMAPIEIVQHHTRTGDAEARGRALKDAEASYREFIERYPSQGYTISARAKLVDVLTTEKRFGEAVDELLLIAQAQRGKQAGVLSLLRAASLALTEMKDVDRALEILDRGSSWYEGSDLGRRLAGEAARIRKENGR